MRTAEPSSIRSINQHLCDLQAVRITRTRAIHEACLGPSSLACARRMAETLQFLQSGRHTGGEELDIRSCRRQHRECMSSVYVYTTHWKRQITQLRSEVNTTPRTRRPIDHKGVEQQDG